MSAPSLADLRDQFQKDPGSIVLHENEDSLSPVSVMGADQIHIGRISADSNSPGSFSMWIVVDNLRIAAANAVQTAEHIIFAPAL
jgi:aspartate-semialdehyde dehydrogenase